MLVLRNANINDMQQYFSWVNDGLVRQNSIFNESIDWEEHQKWFKNKLIDKNTFLYLAEKKQSKVGQVRFECENSEASLAYSISYNHRKQGLGKLMLQNAIEKFREDCPVVKIITARAKVANLASNKILLSLGFVAEDNTKGIISYHLK